ncbi:MAG: hypothetical protein ACP5E3_19065, partial [Bacteroidales bacterium]
MKKNTTFLKLLMALMLLPMAHITAVGQTLTDSWEKTATDLPFIAGSGNQRGMVYGNERIYLAGREAGATMHVINAHTGEAVKMMSVEGVEALTYALVNAEYSEDGSILACPLTLHANIESGWGSGYFTIYRWENEDSDPEPFIVYNEKDLRLGEGLTVIGDVTDDAVIMAGASGVRTVLRWIITDGVIGDVEEITLPETVNTGIVASACPAGLTAADGFWYNNA